MAQEDQEAQSDQELKNHPEVSYPSEVQIRESMTLEERIMALESEVQTLRSVVQEIPDTMEKEKDELRRNIDELNGLRSRVKEAVHTSTESSAVVNTLEKRVDVVRKDATSGVVVSIVVFSIMFIISLFIRV